MTPQILLDALRHAFVTMSAVSLLIFDECHRACGNHPYTRVMKVMGFSRYFSCFDNIGT
jgi:endoribonuclease Dicer